MKHTTRAARFEQRASKAPRSLTKVAALLGPGALAIGDYYNQMVLRGFVRAAAEFGVSFDVVISPTRDRITKDLDACCVGGGYGMILAAGNEMQAAVGESAKKFPGQRFALIDGSIEHVGNVVSYSSDPRGIAFLCGSLSATMEGGEAAGCVLWSDNPVAREWIEGFTAGVKSARRDSKAYYSFAGSVEEAHEKASLQFKKGVRVIMCHAGSADAGIFQAARESGGRLLGFLDERRMDPEHVLFDVVRKLEPVVIDAVKRGASKRFEAGVLVRIGLKEGGFSLDLENAHESVSPADKRAIAKLATEIKRGDFDALLRHPESIGGAKV
jgi:basic membrane protein A and related proteins